MNAAAVIRALDRIEFGDLFEAIQDARRRRRWKVIYQRCAFLAMASAQADSASGNISAYGVLNDHKDGVF